MTDIYFDNGATTKVSGQVADVVCKTMIEDYGNPSSLHSKGLAAENLIKDARKVIANSIKANADEIIFTGSGSEANNLAIIGSAKMFREKGNIITTKIEHKSVLECMKRLEEVGFAVKYLDVDENGLIFIDQLKEFIDGKTQLVSIMHINNECGSIQPIEEIYNTVKSVNTDALVHIDNIQGYCKFDTNVKFCDMMSVSAHKIHGPKGVGALYVRQGIRLSPVIYGGGQEKGIRSGTENVPAIVGFAKAVVTYNADKERLSQIKKYIAKRVTEEIPKVYINGDVEISSPYILNIAMIGLRSEIILHSLEQRGIFVSSGSACSSHKPSPSHVLTAMGYKTERVDSSIRLSFCADNTMEEAKAFCDALAEISAINKKIRRI